MAQKTKIAVLDDYQQAALKMANWSDILMRTEVTVFHDHVAEEPELIERLIGYQVICVMRERTPLTRSLLSALPNLKLIISTGSRNASIDEKAVEDLGITLKHTGYLTTGAPELTWALLLAIARHIPQENSNLKVGGWQQTVGVDMAGKTIGILGLGRIGHKMATYAKAFDMNVIAWSQNLTQEKADEAGAKLVSKEELFKQADFVVVTLVLSERTRHIVGEAELSIMKPTAYFVNTSRGPLADEAALISALQNKKIAGAAIDVFDTEPLPQDHPFRTLPNVMATPHIGYVTENTYKLFYGDTVNILKEWLDKA